MGNTYDFFQSRNCDFFPCHKTNNPSDFNCMFCYCPLYAHECEGQYEILENGVKDCSNCLIPHYNYEYVINKLKEINKTKQMDNKKIDKVAKFEKVSFEQFKKDWIATFSLEETQETEDEIREIYNNIKLPKRATTGSAGYDFYAPCDIQLCSKEMVKIPTGIRVSIFEGWWLGCLPRSGLGFKFKLQLNNTMGVIDSDYYHSDNEGHIFIKMTNDGDKNMEVKSGNGFAQGIFIPFGITTDDEVDGIRNGGFGSTEKKKKKKKN